MVRVGTFYKIFFIWMSSFFFTFLLSLYWNCQTLVFLIPFERMNQDLFDLDHRRESFDPLMDEKWRLEGVRILSHHTFEGLLPHYYLFSTVYDIKTSFSWNYGVKEEDTTYRAVNT